MIKVSDKRSRKVVEQRDYFDILALISNIIILVKEAKF